MAERLTLEGRFVRLEPLSERHVAALAAAVAEDRSSYQWTAAPDGLPETTTYVREALAKATSGEQLAFATVRKGRGSGGADVVVGTTRFCELSEWRWPAGSSHQRHGVPDSVEIGGTWLSRSAQRTEVNSEAKLLMLTHAFEVWQVHCVWLVTDVRNAVPGRPLRVLEVTSRGSCEPTGPARTTPCARLPATPSWRPSGRR